MNCANICNLYSNITRALLDHTPAHVVQRSILPVASQRQKEAHDSPSKWPSKAMPSKLIKINSHVIYELLQPFFEASTTSLGRKFQM